MSQNLLASLHKKGLNLKVYTPEYVAKHPDLQGLLSARSHVGGTPLLPPGFAWPQALWQEDGAKDESNVPLIFSAQIDLSDIQGYACAAQLPDHGLLSFFSCGDNYNYVDPNSCKVLYFEDVSSLVPTPMPETKAQLKLIPECRFQVFSELTFMSTGEIDDEVNPIVTSDGHTLTEAERTQLIDNYEDYFEQLIDEGKYAEEDFLEFLGYGYYIQNCPLQPGSVHLFTLNSAYDSEKIEWIYTIGDAGSIYFMIDSEDLKKHDFSKVFCESQCF